MVGRSLTDGRESTRQVMLTCGDQFNPEEDTHHLEILGAGERGDVSWLCADIVYNRSFKPRQLTRISMSKRRLLDSP